MISAHIFKTLSEGVTGLENGTAFNIYPKKVPDGVDFNRAVVYNKLDATAVYGQLGTSIQLTCLAKTYGDAEALSHEVARVFRNKRYATDGDVIATAVQDITDLPHDDESQYYLVSVSIYIKTRKAIG